MLHSPHLLIPAAAHTSEACLSRMPTLVLPHLEQLLSRLLPDKVEEAATTTFSPPHEHALARAYGLPIDDGLIPWAAWQVQQEHRGSNVEPWAWLTPCHWQMGIDRATLLPPDTLQLSDSDARTLIAAMQPYFEQDDIHLIYHTPARWLARGEPLRSLQTASLDRAVGQAVDTWLPRGPSARTLRRLQSEMQMLLYTHPINDERQRDGLLPVNSFWLSGSGHLPTTTDGEPPDLRVDYRLRDAALLDDWAAWADAWRVVDTQECARLLQELDQGLPVTLTLCGESSARRYIAGPQTLWQRLTRNFQHQPLWKTLHTL
jgi:hypothetical protein